MDVTKIIKRLEDRIERYEEKRKYCEAGSALEAIYSTKITEVRIIICDICEWCMNEILKEEKEV